VNRTTTRTKPTSLADPAHHLLIHVTRAAPRGPWKSLEERRLLSDRSMRQREGRRYDSDAFDEIFGATKTRTPRLRPRSHQRTGRG